MSQSEDGNSKIGDHTVGVFGYLAWGINYYSSPQWHFDLDTAHDIYHDDLIVEFPQSGERILYNLQVWNHDLFPSWGHITYELIYSILIFRRMIHKWLLKPSTRILIELI